MADDFSLPWERLDLDPDLANIPNFYIGVGKKSKV